MAATTYKPQTEDFIRWADIKFGLLAEGAGVDPAAWARMRDAKQPIRTRSGVSGGLDVRLADNIDVNVPIREAFASDSSFTLSVDGDEFVVVRDGEVLCTFAPVPGPAYYARRTVDGREPMHRIAQMCSADRLCYGMTGPTCYFWARRRRCQYCSIGRNFDADLARKQAGQLMEVLRAAVDDPILPARHVLLGGGTPPGKDMGALLAAELCSAIKAEFPDLSVYVMIAAPLRDEHVHAVFESGADEIGLNLEFWSAQAWQRYIPGKDKVIGRRRYLTALETCVALWGPIRTRSILIAGLEPLEHTYLAAKHLAGMGVMPIISPFRPLEGSVLEGTRGASGADYVELWQRVDEELAPLGIPLGPACIPCQNNTLALPTDGRYH